MFEIVAVLLYGAVAYAAALVTVILAHSTLGGALVFAAAGLTYLFQLVQVTGSVPRLHGILFFASIAALPLAVLVALAGY